MAFDDFGAFGFVLVEAEAFILESFSCTTAETFLLQYWFSLVLHNLIAY